MFPVGLYIPTNYSTFLKKPVIVLKNSRESEGMKGEGGLVGRVRGNQAISELNA